MIIYTSQIDNAIDTRYYDFDVAIYNINACTFIHFPYVIHG